MFRCIIQPDNTVEAPYSDSSDVDSIVHLEHYPVRLDPWYTHPREVLIALAIMPGLMVFAAAVIIVSPSGECAYAFVKTELDQRPFYTWR